jgi:hypothetical protein
MLSLVLAGCTSKNDYRPDSYLNSTKKDEVVSRIIRYVAEKPKKANDSTKFDPIYNNHYQTQAAEHRFTHYFVSTDDVHYFMIQRRAPSLYEKYVATGGKMRFDERGNLIEYEEVFRTWKMAQDTLTRRGSLLFDKMVKEESLEPYLTRNSPDIEYIEFPDENVYYDKSSRTWKSKQYGTVEEMVATP